MALTTENGMDTTMLVSPTGGYGGGNGLFGSGDSWLGILFLIALCNGGFGFGGFGGGYGAMMGMGMADGFGLYPWLNNSQNINDGFRDQMLNSTVQGIQNSITSGFGDVQLGIAGVNQNICQTGNGITSAINQGFASTNLGMCQGFNGVNNSIFGAQTAISQQLNSNELASLNRSFAEQTANTQGFTNVQSGIADLRYTEATEACNTRAASAQNTRDIIDSQARGTQAILDKLCALELDGVKAQLAQAQRDNVALQNAVNMSAMRESQTAQTAQILAGQAAEIDGVYNRLKNCPVGTYNVCNPLTPANPCGCGCNGSF